MSAPPLMDTSMTRPPVDASALDLDALSHEASRPSVGRLVACVCLVLLAAGIIWSFVSNPRIHWGVVREYLLSADIVRGAMMSVSLTIYAMSLGITVGIVVALMRLSNDVLLSGLARFYVTTMRGIPALVWLIFWYNLAAIYPHIGLTLPGVGGFYVEANEAITPLTAAVLGLGLCEGAYMAEIVRGGVLSIDPGQREAALAVGMTRAQAMRKVVLPQALRIIVPPTGNQVIGMLKLTSLASVISFTELLTSAQLIYNRNFEVIPLLIVVSLWYTVLSLVLGAVQRYLEKRFGRHRSRAATSRFSLRKHAVQSGDFNEKSV